MEGTCDNCGNTYHNVMQIMKGGETYTFDSFECAIQVLAPTCGHCDTRVIGHGVEDNGDVYCCVHCAEEEGVEGLADRT